EVVSARVQADRAVVTHPVVRARVGPGPAEQLLGLGGPGVYLAVAVQGRPRPLVPLRADAVVDRSVRHARPSRARSIVRNPSPAGVPAKARAAARHVAGQLATAR